MSDGTSVRRQVKVINAGGLHAGPASQVVQLAATFDATVQIRCGGKSVDARSILSLLTLGITQGSEVELIGSGVEAGAALDALQALFESGFDE